MHVAPPTHQPLPCLSRCAPFGTPQEVVDPARSKDTTRIYMTCKAQPWHVDPVDFVSLLFLKTAKSGGLRWARLLAPVRVTPPPPPY